MAITVPRNTSGSLNQSQTAGQGNGRVDDVPQRSELNQAKESLPHFTNQELAGQAGKILDRLQNALNKMNSGKLPPIHAFELEDSSILIEWMLPHQRMGFNLEVNPQESGWFLVTDASASDIQAFGSLSGANIDWLLEWLLQVLSFVRVYPKLPKT